MYTELLIKYGEIALKGRNRNRFEEALVNNIKLALGPLTSAEVRRTFGRIFVELANNDDYLALIKQLQGVFGIVAISPVAVAPLDMSAITNQAIALFHEVPAGASFRVSTRRPNKNFNINSVEISRTLGYQLLAHYPHLIVDLHQPQISLQVEIRDDGVYLYHHRYPGPGGLPKGIAGKAVLLLSGGIDSPVAGWLAMKRGLDLIAFHSYSYPFTSERSKEKVIDLCRVLARYGHRLHLYVNHFTDIQTAIRQHCPEAYYVTIMRRMMLRLAQHIARAEGALALITGESLGQVASQTLESIYTINEVAELPVLRPLITWDKSEIIIQAKAIDTYNISIQPFEDCCTLFVPNHPSTRPSLERVQEAEAGIPWVELLQQSLEQTERMEIEEDGYARNKESGIRNQE